MSKIIKTVLIAMGVMAGGAIGISAAVSIKNKMAEDETKINPDKSIKAYAKTIVEDLKNPSDEHKFAQFTAIFGIATIWYGKIAFDNKKLYEFTKIQSDLYEEGYKDLFNHFDKALTFMDEVWKKDDVWTSINKHPDLLEMGDKFYDGLKGNA